MIVEGTRRFHTQYTRDVSSNRRSVSGGLSTLSFFPGSPDAPINQSIPPQSTISSNTLPAQSSRPPTTTTPTSLGASRTQNGTSTQTSTSGSSLGGVTAGATRGQNTSTSYSSASNPATLASDSSASRASSTKPTTSTSKPISTPLIIAIAAAAGLLIIGIPLIILLVRRKKKRSNVATEESKLPPPSSITSITRQTPGPSGSPSSFGKRPLMMAAAIPSRNARASVESFGPGPRPSSQNLRQTAIQARQDMEYMRSDNVTTPMRRVYRPNVRDAVRRSPSPDRYASNARTTESSDIPISYNSQRNRQQENNERRPYQLPTGPRPTRTPTLPSEFTSPRRAPNPLNPQPTRIVDTSSLNRQYVSDLTSNPFSARSSYYNDEFPRTPTSAIMAARRSSVASATDSQVSGFYGNDEEDSVFEEYNNESQSDLSSGRRPLTSMDPDYPMDFSYYEA
ncbi:uncharacterized protein MELLADRAFT_89075 [Melampsora larici-populina 98AG31]|uniref:Uncharacterized protein n=1 Tax=Melampsora larici-populina (strain 98AG31 / pathotype 3-4-7) TaxID=747676 RepID=F4R6W6_MELLP|nr:uncharacterized protein MELLADRAFT_89075 [Melampsora larici-populina 98AG31]EGG12383.1 hypothetical protein MELLADRAFT_89075 [Melampsora larici-populina 98AG31]